MRPGREATSTIGGAFRLAGQLVVGGYESAGEYVFREAAVPLALTPQLRVPLGWWSQISATVLRPDRALGARLHGLARALVYVGHADEAVRVLTIGMRWLPGADVRFVTARSDPTIAPPTVTRELAADLSREGLAALTRGEAQGVALLAAALRVGGSQVWPGAAAHAAIHVLPRRRQITTAGLTGLARATQHLGWLGQEVYALRLGMLMPEAQRTTFRILDSPVFEQAGEPELVIDIGAISLVRDIEGLSEELRGKGYVAEAAELTATALGLRRPRDRFLHALFSQLESHVLPSVGILPSTWARTKFLSRMLPRRLAPMRAENARWAELPGVAELLAASESSAGGGRGDEPRREGTPPPPPAPPEDTDLEHARFLFRLEGTHVRRATVESGRDVDLVFDYGAPSGRELATAKGTAVDEAKRRAVDLELVIVPEGFTVREGPWRKTAKFREGRLVETVRFRLRAPAPEATKIEHPGVFVVFYINGLGLYDAFVPIAVVPNIAAVKEENELPPIELDLDNVTTAAGRDRHFTAQIWKMGAVYSVAGRRKDHEPLRGMLTELTQGDLQDALDATWGLLESVAEHPAFRNNSDPLWPDDAHRTGFIECMDQVMTAGWQLYERLHADPAFRPLLDTVENLNLGDRVEIYTDRCVLPWPILYPEPFDAGMGEEDKAAARHPEKLWGFRFNIECLLQDGIARRADPVYRERFLSMCVNPLMNNDMEVTDPYRPVDEQESFYAKNGGEKAGELLTSFDQTRALLQQKSPSSTTFIYFYCHGARAEHGEPERLFVEGKQKSITPSMIAPKFVRFPKGPIVFLNSCSSGSYSPFLFTTFLGKFRESGAEGMVASACSVPLKPAAAFGPELMRRYLGGTPIGEALLQLRRELLLHDNPLGLLYTLHCPLDLKTEAAA